MTVEARIRHEIETRIRSGEWKPGHRIPFEHELVAAHGCSRATVSKALGALARAGLIERRRKAGSFVAHPQVHSAVLEVADLPRLIADRGQDYRWALTLRRDATAADLAEESGIAAPALVVEGVHHGDDRPFCCERRVIAIDAIPDAAGEGFVDAPPGSWLLARVPWTEARHGIAAVEATPALARSLGVASGTACLQLERWTWRAGVMLTHVVQTFPGDRFDMVAVFKPGT
ncbi:MAG: UTRA domain-containing protein [Sphingomonadales bacterium]|nr:MAG: UTRA domain-containing protein [Sphingomonadales bacterium]